MPKPELTKKHFAETLKALVAQKPLDKISVNEIVGNAGLNRQTFYYHFTDKQELVCWIFDTEYSALTDKSRNNTILDEMTNYMCSEKKFYIAALTSEAQNNLRDHIYKVYYRQINDKINVILNGRKMEKSAAVRFARFFSHALVGTLVQWAGEGMKNDTNPYNEEYASVLEESLEFIVNKYAEK